MTGLKLRQSAGRRAKILAVSVLVSLLGALPAAAAYDKLFFAGMKARNVGPGNMSGRVAAVAAVTAQPEIIYIGTATGGVWKSTNGGTTWKPIFDEQDTSSIGAVAVFQPQPEIVWAGSGEGNTRNSAGVGRGIYKSIDGGKSWQKLGLEKTERIHRILLHPTNPDIAYVAAMGTTWGENPDRGVFKTTDGGKTWNKILYVDERTGVGDLAIDPSNPDKLIAAMWEHRRWPWAFKSGGSGSGLYITTDGGGSWRKLEAQDGLPAGELGRIGIAVAPSNPKIVYALVEANKNVLLRSEDGGSSWKTVNTRPDINPRPFYFADLEVNPKDENLLYRLQVNLDISTDGGKTFKPTAPQGIHSDHHALWIHPNGNTLINGNDGGIAISYDRGKKWQFVDNLPLGQFYHIGVDMEQPYNVYGGLQDNGSWRGPSNALKPSGILNASWEAVGFGDGFATLPDPENAEYGYAMSQGGNLFYFNSRTGVRKAIRPTETETKHRYNWNAALAIDPFDPKTIYYGSQFVHKSPDKGNSWQIISPDLTTDDPEKQKQAESGGLTRDVTAAENHCTILSIAPSALKKGLLWASTDDGNVQLTTDGGKSWQRVSDSLIKAGLVPAGTWVPHVEASKHDPATAYVVFDDHRRSNWQSYVFVTRDYGRSWKSLVTPTIDGFAHVIEEDPVKADLLYLGTEFGLFVSADAGKSWFKWTQGLPTVPVTDLVVHPREQDLVIGTHGRGIYILDDIRPLRSINEQIATQPLYLFPVADPDQMHFAPFSGPYFFAGDALFRGKARPYGALLTYVLNGPGLEPAKADAEEGEEADKDKEEAATAPKSSRPIPPSGAPATGEDKPVASGPAAETQKKEEAKLDIEILDDTGKVIRTVKAPMKAGLNRIAWDLRREKFAVPQFPLSDPERIKEREKADKERRGTLVPPGKYTARIQYQGSIVSQSFEVKPDPRIPYYPAARRQSYQLALEAGAMLESVAKAYQQIWDTRKTIQTATQGDKPANPSLAERGKALDAKLANLADRMAPNEDRQGIYDRTAEVANQIAIVLGALQSSYDGPNQPVLVKFEKVKQQTATILAEYDTLKKSEVVAFEQALRAAGYPAGVGTASQSAQP
ncbi:MAG: hypothetical protein KME03_10805 [Aphanocapsa lilacina HA4352-LM1]|jgi:photosystem II stability/assembly factor-like uncharacterized protein|nr:hypothetical protein [Aphanocapsa lilacina HA4352-LM1]